MKIYSLPEELEATLPPIMIDGEFNENWFEDEEAHRAQVAMWLKENGYNGPYSGEVVRFPRADGYANYMLADCTPGLGLRSFLLHLPYGDAWYYDGVEYIPKSKIVEMIKQERRVAKLFGSTNFAKEMARKRKESGNNE